MFHSRNWQWDEEDIEQTQSESDEDKVKIAKAVITAKQIGKGFCMHEVLANKASDEGNENPLCPPVIMKDIKEGKMEVEVGSRDKDDLATVSNSNEVSSGNESNTSLSATMAMETREK